MEVDAAPQEDLTIVLAGIREHYEAVATKNRKELEVWFQAKVSRLHEPFHRAANLGTNLLQVRTETNVWFHSLIVSNQRKSL